MSKEMKSFALASGAAAFGVIIALLALEYGKDLPIIKQARDAL